MNKKTIQIIIIVVMFGGAGVVLYNGFFKNSSVPVNTALLNPLNVGAPTEGVPTASAVLPYGNKFNFDVLTRQKLNYEFEKVEVKPEIEVGKNPNELMKPVAATKSTPVSNASSTPIR